MFLLDSGTEVVLYKSMSYGVSSRTKGAVLDSGSLTHGHPDSTERIINLKKENGSSGREERVRGKRRDRRDRDEMEDEKVSPANERKIRREWPTHLCKVLQRKLRASCTYLPKVCGV